MTQKKAKQTYEKYEENEYEDEDDRVEITDKKIKLYLVRAQEEPYEHFLEQYFRVIANSKKEAIAEIEKCVYVRKTKSLELHYDYSKTNRVFEDAAANDQFVATPSDAESSPHQCYVKVIRTLCAYDSLDDVPYEHCYTKESRELNRSLHNYYSHFFLRRD